MSVTHNADGFVIGPDGFAESSADLLADFLAEHGDDPDEGPPEDWPDWTDAIRLGLGDDPPVNGHALEAAADAFSAASDAPTLAKFNGHALEAAADALEVALYEPTEQDWADFHAWCREQDARNQDLEDARRVSEWQDMLEGIARITDDDLMAAGLPVG